MPVAPPTTAGPPTPAHRTLGRNLPAAIAVGLGLATLFLATLFIHPVAFLIFIAVMVTLALFELDRAFRSKGLQPAMPVALAAGLVLFFGAYVGGPGAQSAGLALLVVGAAAWALLNRDVQRPASSMGVTCLMVLWVPFLASYIGLLLARPQGEWFVMATVALTVSSDIGAFAFGSRYGRHKLAPSVSPAKSWEGFAGGLATALILAASVTAHVPGFTWSTALALAVGVCVAATIGDLAESMVKRDLDVKDLGGILPGHGGIMERADAIIFALPAAHLLLLALGS
ncbi:hypothetical protein BH24ACT14_BH24ACT14_03860 [soil metagenome]